MMDVIETTVDQWFADKGFTKAGGVWGDAQWKRLSEHLVVSVGQGYGWSDDQDFTDAPRNEHDPFCLFVYHGPFDAGWSVTSGEAPTLDRFERHDFLTHTALQGHLRRLGAL